MSSPRFVGLGLLAIAAALAGCAGGEGGGDGDGGGYRFDAIFDTAKGVLPGVPVTVAGTRVGTVEEIGLTTDYDALVAMRIDDRFGPFRSDATCQVRPQGVIGESFVNCTPGNPSSSPLAPGAGGKPVVALAQTSVPVELTDFFDIWAVPVRQRLTLLLSELGAGLAGRGEDLNAVLRRTNPALRKANQVLAVLDRQRADLREGISASNTVLAELADHRDGLRSLIDEGSKTFGLIARRPTALREGIRRLPPLLRAVRPSLEQLDELSVAAPPVLGDLRAAGPRLDSLLREVDPFADAAVPAIGRLSPTISLGTRVLSEGTPVADRLREFTRRAEPTGRLLNTLLVAAREDGALEGLQRLAYNYASIASRFDAKGHLFPTAILANGCSTFATKEDPKCSARYGAEGGDPASPQKPEPEPEESPEKPTAEESPAAAEPDQRPVPGEAGPKPARQRGAPKPAPAPPVPDQPAEGLLDFLLR